MKKLMWTRLFGVALLFALIGCSDGSGLPWAAGGQGKAETNETSSSAQSSSLVVVHDEVYVLTDGNKETPEIAFELQPDTSSFLIQVVQQEPDPGTFYQIVGLAPLGQNPLELRGPEYSLASLYGHELAYLYPSTDDPAAFEPRGSWRFKVKDIGQRWLSGFFEPLSEKKIRVTVVAKQMSSPATRGHLKVHFHFTGSNGLTAAVAQQEQGAFQKSLETLKGVFRSNGTPIDIEVAGYHDLNIPPGTRHAQLMTFLSEAIQRTEISDALHVVYIGSVDEILEKVQMDRMAMHISGGLPGLLPTKKVNYGAVLMSSCQGFPGMGLSLNGNQLAHEIAHYLGLEHVVHLDGTPDRIFDNDDAGYLNVMTANPRWPPDAVAQLTAGQRHVVLNHPLVKLVSDPQ